MKTKSILRILAYVAVISSLAIASTGCKKEEPKVEKAAEQAAPQAAQGPTTAANAALPEDGFKAEITVNNPPTTIKAKAEVTVEVKVKNTSNALWPAKGQVDGKFQTRLSYHWLDKNGNIVINDGTRADLPSDLAQGKDVTLSAKVTAPEKPGNYVLEFDMMQELVSWFGPKGSPTAKVNVTVN